MRIYKIISDIYFVSLYIIGVFHKPVLLYLVPLLPILIFIFHRKNTFISLSSGTGMTVLDILVLVSLKYIYLASVPLVLLSIEASFKEGDNSFIRDIEFRSIGTSTIYLLSIIFMVSFLSIFKVQLMAYSITSILYIIVKDYRIYRDIDDIQNNFKDKYIIVRDHQSDYLIKFLNKGKFIWKISIKYKEISEYKLIIKPDNFILKPNTDINVKLIINGYKIGNYKGEIEVRLIDSDKFIDKKLLYNIDITIKPKLDVAIAAGRRIIEAYGAGGEEYTVESIYKSKSRLGEFLGVRMFIPGDDPKHIHFKKSVEHQKLIIKEYEASGFKNVYLIVDISVGRPEDLDDVLYNAVSLLINYLIYGIRDIGLIIFNSKEIILKFPLLNPAYILKKILEYSDKFRVDEKYYKFILEKPEINCILRDDELARIEYLLIDESYRKSILAHIHDSIIKLVRYPSMMVLITSNSEYRNLYPLFEYRLKKIGHEIREFKKGMRLEIEELSRYIV